jgi:hypothetical protein
MVGIDNYKIHGALILALDFPKYTASLNLVHNISLKKWRFVKFSRFQLNKFFASLNFSHYTLENFVLFGSLGGPELQRLRPSLNTENFISEKVPLY